VDQLVTRDGAPLEAGAHPRCQLLAIRGLRDDVVRTKLERSEESRQVVVPREHDRRDGSQIRIGTELRERSQSCRIAGHQDEVGTSALHMLQRIRDIGGFQDDMALLSGATGEPSPLTRPAGDDEDGVAADSRIHGCMRGKERSGGGHVK
jgi:hypothetical protein